MFVCLACVFFCMLYTSCANSRVYVIVLKAGRWSVQEFTRGAANRTTAGVYKKWVDPDGRKYANLKKGTGGRLQCFLIPFSQ